MKILIACEESQAVCIEFRKRGHEAYSCDVIECSGGHPDWHIKCDVLEQLDKGWDMMIAFPPCTHLCVSGAAWFEEKKKDGRQQSGIDFFMRFTNCDIQKIAIENPVGIMSGLYRKPDQIIQPYYFGDSFSKKTCLWLKNLDPLYHNEHPTLFDSNVTHVDKGEQVTLSSGKTMPKWYSDAFKLSPDERSKERSKTFPGIARAMAEQWG
jgi:hypothetical protein